MKTPNRRPWLFVLLTVLILLAGGMAVGMAARLVVVPQADQTVEVDTPTPPSFVSQSVDEVVFYPWNQYDPEYLAANAPALHEYFMDWCMDSLLHGADLLRVTLPEGWDTREPLVSSDTFYWKDIPVTDQQSSQPALLDVGGGYSTQDFGLSIVARSTGEPPTRTQKEAALAQVQQDVCQLFSPHASHRVEELLLEVWEQLNQTPYMESGGIWYEANAATMLGNLLSQLGRVRDTLNLDESAPLQTQLEQISAALEVADCWVQLVTTQRQVVVVLTTSDSDVSSWYSVGLYYDVVLEEYSGIAINGRSGYGY